MHDTTETAGAHATATPTATRRTWVPRALVTAFRRSSVELVDLLGDLPADAERVYLVGDRPGGGGIDGLTTWANAPLPDGWTPGRHYLHGTRPTLRYARPDGSSLEILRVEGWLGDGHDLGVGEARDALELTRRALAAAWGEPTLPLWSTAATTARDLWLRTIPYGVEVPTLEADLAELVRSTTGQGRWQRFHHGEATAPGLYGWDLRFAYGALLRNLPVGPAVHTDEPADHRAFLEGGELAYVRARYRVAFEVPAGWDHVGLLPVHVDGHEPDGCDACGPAIGGPSSWCYPSAPGWVGETWADGVELLLAARRGWRFGVLERLTFAEGKPLEIFAERLLDARSRLVDAHRDAPAVATAAASAIRSIVLHGVGSFLGRGHTITRSVPEADAEQVPADADGLDWQGDRIVWREQRDAAWPETVHPEWSAAVWARCRTRLLSWKGAGALHVPVGQLVALRQDAVYVTHPTGWPADGGGEVGRFRRVSAVDRPITWPRDAAELLAARTTTTTPATPAPDDLAATLRRRLAKVPNGGRLPAEGLTGELLEQYRALATWNAAIRTQHGR